MTTLALRDPSLLETRALIDGDWIASDDSYPITNPATGAQIAHVASMTLAQAETAIESAHRAQPLWAAMTGKERAAILRRLYDLMVENADDLALILTAEMGKPLAEAKGEVLYGASYVEWFAEEAKRIYGETIPGHQADKRLMVIRQPIGVAASITPWNFPNAMITRKCGPALAAGCGFVAKPAGETPLSALAIAVLAERAGLPGGLFSVVTSSSSSDIGKEFCENPTVRKLTFTGSTEVGRVLLREAADQVVNCSMELGGNAPFLVCHDADLDAAVDGAMVAKMRNAGEACTAANRFFVHADVAEEFGRRLAERMAALRVGPGTDAATEVGPLVNEEAAAKVDELVRGAVDAGGRVVTGGSRPEREGWYYEPTVLVDVPAGSDILAEEIFGPVAPIVTFTDEDEAVRLANDTEFGLVSYVYTRDLARGLRLSDRLDSGMVGLNRGLVSDPAAPFGGTKQSGVGREGGHEGMLDYLESKYVAVTW